MKCLAVAGSANNQLGGPADAHRLRETHIPCAPDYAINMDGALAIIGMETKGWLRVEADERVRSIGQTLRRIFEVAAAEEIFTEATARRITESRLSAITI